MDKHYIPNTKGVIFANKNKFSFSIDSILLSYFSKVKKDKILIDIGAGTGIIGFRINFLNNLKTIYLIEIQKENAKLIEHSIVENKLNNVVLLNKDLKECYNDFENSSVDYIVSNPPYKKMNTGILNKDENFLISRYEYALKLEDILDFSYKKLKSGGKVFLIYSMERLVDVLSESISTNIYKKPHLFMVELVKNGNSNLFVEDNIYIYNKSGEYTDKIKEIYYGQDF